MHFFLGALRVNNITMWKEKQSVDPDQLIWVYTDFKIEYRIWKLCVQQWYSQNAEKVTHIKGRLLYQAMILYNYLPFHKGNSERKEFAPRGSSGSEFFPLRAASSLRYGKSLLPHKVSSLECKYFYYTRS